MEAALADLRTLPFEDIGFATVDHHRDLRWGFPEVIYCAGKTPEQVAGIAERISANSDRVLGTRASVTHFEAARERVPDLQYHELARCIWLDRSPEGKRHDGIVIVDHHRCIGCRYCMIACPYNARFFNLKDNEEWPNKQRPKRSHGVAEACHLCAHRLDEGLMPACVEACARIGAGALSVGDLNNSGSDIARVIASVATKRIRPDLGTDPKVYYIGL